MKNKADDGDERAGKVLELERNYDSLLSTILIGNNLVNIANTAIATVLFVELFGSYGASISTVVTTILVLIFGEISPKSVAKEHAEGFALFIHVLNVFGVIPMTNYKIVSSRLMLPVRLLTEPCILEE